MQYAKQWQQLYQARQKNRLHHALLFVGSKGIGKTAFAIELARAILCVKPKDNGFACEDCHPCHLFHANSHADFLMVEPEEKKQTITIEQIRSVVQLINETPLHNGYRVVIIRPATSMNINAANALLKTLEEPTANVLFILISDNSLRLSATIRSRCQKLTFFSGVEETYLQEVKQALADLKVGSADPLQLASTFHTENMLSVIDTIVHSVTAVLQDSLLKASSVTHLLRYLDEAQEARKDLIAGINLNKQLLLEKLFINWVNYASR